MELQQRLLFMGWGRRDVSSVKLSMWLRTTAGCFRKKSQMYFTEKTCLSENMWGAVPGIGQMSEPLHDSQKPQSSPS